MSRIYQHPIESYRYKHIETPYRFSTDTISYITHDHVNVNRFFID